MPDDDLVVSDTSPLLNLAVIDRLESVSVGDRSEFVVGTHEDALEVRRNVDRGCQL